jgi:hypothetical protein
MLDVEDVQRASWRMLASGEEEPPSDDANLQARF